jgi:GDPmannose 4,6-dehydratase
MLQDPQPKDFVIATGQTVSLQYFVERAFAKFGLDWKKNVSSDQSLLRPSVIRYGADGPLRAKEKMGWYFTHDVDGIVNALCASARGVAI